MDSTNERNVRDKYYKWKECTADIHFMCEKCKGTDRCLQDGDHTDGHYITVHSRQFPTLHQEIQEYLLEVSQV